MLHPTLARLARRLLSGTVLPLAVLGTAPLSAQEAAPPAPGLDALTAQVERVLAAPMARKGADSCLKCHDEDNEVPVMPLFRTKHAVTADPRTPLAQGQCESCHGPGGEHELEPEGDAPKAPILAFGQTAWTPVATQNGRCLNCHENHSRIEWAGSSHEFNQVACAACHQIHVARDPVLDKRSQDEVCFTCHANQRAKFYQASHHPVREGRMACSDCHDPHGEDGSGLRLAGQVRELCTTCHAEKRGPFLWEHQPAAEDCTLCHASHGANQPALLKKRAPQLCQQCHAPAGHPSQAYDGSRIPTQFLSVKGCLNCHSQIHGSNHPSGATPVR